MIWTSASPIWSPKNPERGGVFEMEYRIIRPDGEVRWLHHICQPVHDAEGNFLGTRGSNRDITERKGVEEKLKTTLQRFYQITRGYALWDPAGYR